MAFTFCVALEFAASHTAATTLIRIWSFIDPCEFGANLLNV
jgi:hypothetical protein